MLTKTTNGENALDSTGNATVDLFYNIGSCRNQQEKAEMLFDKALQENPNVTAGITSWARDVRGGAGERNIYRKLLKKMIDQNPVIAEKMLKLTPQIGRYDDLNVAIGTSLEAVALDEWKKGLNANNELAYKWVNIKKDHALRKSLKMSPKEFRKYIVKGRPKIVEKKMCANEWDQITYEHVPSVCMNKSKRAFKKHDTQRFDAWMNDKNAKMNASALFPYNVYHNYEANEKELAAKQWLNMKLELKGNFIPVIDVSGSMNSLVAGKISARAIAVSLGVYVSQRNTGHFQNKVIAFAENPSMMNLPISDDVNLVFDAVQRLDMGYSTNFHKVYELILNEAVASKITQDKMPDSIIVISDMQFNEASGANQMWGRKTAVAPMDATAFQKMKEIFEHHGYKLPKMVFWNVSPSGNAPTGQDEENVSLISGFSPFVLQNVLQNTVQKITPQNIMMSVIEKYMKQLDLPY